MPTNTYVELDRVTLTSNSGPVTFSNIPQTYTNLRVVMTGGFVDSGFMIGARVGNGSVDTGGNYSYTNVRGNGSSPSSGRKANMVFGAFCVQGGNNLNNIFIVDFLNYSSTTTWKTWISRYGNAGEGADSVVSQWRSNSAINTISIAECGDGGTGSFNYGNMLSGSTFSLYGIRAWANGTTPKATGGDVYEDATYYYHAFPFSSTFTPSQTITADYLVIGGGGGAGGTAGGGGGAGGLRSTVTATGGGGSIESATTLNSGTTYTITVGAGGAGVMVGSSKGGNGGDSSIAGSGLTTITSTGGGGGGSNNTANGNSGGSGGGARGGGTAGSGTANQGFAGGTANGDASGAGGGAGGVGGNSTEGSSAGAGGNGVQITALATPTGTGVNGYYAGGGGGAITAGTGGGAGGLGGGGVGRNGGNNGNGGEGAVSTGSGGGGTRLGSNTGVFGGNGGSGLVIIRYTK